MTAHSAVLCALLLCFPPPPNDGVTLCPSTAPTTTPAMEFPESPPTQAPSQATDPPKAPDVGTGTGVLGPQADCVVALETKEAEGSGGGDAEEYEWVGEDPGGAQGENIAPSATAPARGGGEDGGTGEPSPDAGPRDGAGPEKGKEDEKDEEGAGEESEGADAPDLGAAEEPAPVATDTEPDAEPAPDPGGEATSGPEPSPMGEGGGAPTEPTTSSPTPEPRPTENGTVSRASATTSPATPAPIDDSQDVGDRPPSKKVEETDPVGGLAFEETSATSPFGHALGVTSTTVLFLLGVATLGLRLAVGWPRFPPLYLGRRRLGGDFDTR